MGLEEESAGSSLRLVLSAERETIGLAAGGSWRHSTGAGLKVCVHGLLHDGNDLTPGPLGDQGCLTCASDARAVGARSACHTTTQRDWGRCGRPPASHRLVVQRRRAVEPQSGGSSHGCRSSLATSSNCRLPAMDHTIFDLLQHDRAEVWLKGPFVRERGGMALLLTHPTTSWSPTRKQEYERLL